MHDEVDIERRCRTSRREFVTGMVSGAAVSMLALPAGAASRRSLKSIAAQKGVLFGSSVGAGKAGTLSGSFANPGYLDILRNDCAVLVPENELKSYVIAREPTKYDFEPADRIAGFAASNAIKLRGHTLLWNRPEYMPQWWLESVGALGAGAAEKYIRDYIERVCSHYREQVYSWDVVNETIDPQTGQVRETPFTRKLGFDALRIAYEAAREHAPKAQLVYNDYMSWEAGNEKHRAGVLHLLEQFKARNVPVDALGIQSHIGNDGHIAAVQRKEWQTFVDAVVAMGYRLLITEFDVNDKDLPKDTKTRDARIAAAAKEYLDFMLSYRELDQVLCWGMVDKYSWLQKFSPRADGTAQRPNPYDDTYQPKPLWDAMASAFEAAPARS